MGNLWKGVPHPAWFTAGGSPWQLRPVMWEVRQEWEQIPVGLHQPNSYLAKGCYSNSEPPEIQKLLQWLLKCLPPALRQDKENPTLWYRMVAHCHTSHQLYTSTSFPDLELMATFLFLSFTCKHRNNKPKHHTTRTTVPTPFFSHGDRKRKNKSYGRS